MKAVRIHSYGDASVLQYEDAPLPAIGDGDLLVRVEAAAVNPIDWVVRYGYVAQWFSHTLPLIPGWDVSGVVEAVGGGVTEFAVGDEVFARADIERDGTYAEYVAIDAAHATRKPADLGHVETAAIPHAALTAWQALFDLGELQPGETVLIHAAGGGVGTFAVQLAKRHGATVIGTASSKNLPFLQDLGVDEAIDYTTVKFEDAVKEVDVVLDAVGGDTQHRSWRLLKPGGILVSLVDPPPPEAAASHGVRACLAGTQPNAAQLTELARLVSAGEIRPVVSTVLPLSDVAEAHRLSETRHTRGKIVLRVGA